jgi:hypothetical protein
MQTTIEKPQATTTEALLTEYLEICNRAMAERTDLFWYRQAKRLNRAVWGESTYRTLVYDADPSAIIGEFAIRFDLEQRRLSLIEPGDHDYAFTWKVPLAYLRDVVIERPEWYLEHPLMLDGTWMARRFRDEVNQRLHRPRASHAASLALGAAAGVLVARTLSARRRAG